MAWMPERRAISFDRDVIEDVVKASGGRFTPTQVRWCLRATVSYLHHLARFTDNLAIRIPNLGYAVCNLRDMRKRLGKLERKEARFGLKPQDRIEMDCLRRKIARLEEMGPKKGDPFVRDYMDAWRRYRQEGPFEDMQDFQARLYEDFDDPAAIVSLRGNRTGFYEKEDKDKEDI